MIEFITIKSYRLRPAGLGGGIKLGGGLKTVALGSATTPVAPVVPPAGAAPAAAAPTVPLTPPGAGMATAQLPQATIGLNTAPAASPVSSASFTARKFQEDTDAAPSTLLNVLSFVALPLRLFSSVINTLRTPWKPAAWLAGWAETPSLPPLLPPPMKKRSMTFLPKLLPKSLPMMAPMRKNK